jgi:hypothetical protein
LSRTIGRGRRDARHLAEFFVVVRSSAQRGQGRRDARVPAGSDFEVVEDEIARARVLASRAAEPTARYRGRLMAGNPPDVSRSSHAPERLTGRPVLIRAAFVADVERKKVASL